MRPLTAGASRFLGLWLLGALCSGCITFYQPQVSLQRPVVIDPEVENFKGTRLLIRCIPGDFLEDDEAEVLCRHLRPLFTNQGATVDVEIPNSRGVAPTEEGRPKPDLIIDLKARLLHSENSILLWILMWASGSLIPSITDYTFSQDISIRDGSGFLLATDSLQARFIRYIGVAVWAVNGLADLLWRLRGQRLSGSNANEDFSKDFYGQLSQLAFHARIRAQVLRGLEPEAAPPAAAPSKRAPARAPAPAPVPPPPPLPVPPPPAAPR